MLLMLFSVTLDVVNCQHFRLKNSAPVYSFSHFSLQYSAKQMELRNLQKHQINSIRTNGTFGTFVDHESKHEVKPFISMASHADEDRFNYVRNNQTVTVFQPVFFPPVQVITALELSMKCNRKPKNVISRIYLNVDPNECMIEMVCTLDEIVSNRKNIENSKRRKMLQW